MYSELEQRISIIEEKYEKVISLLHNVEKHYSSHSKDMISVSNAIDLLLKNDLKIAGTMEKMTKNGLGSSKEFLEVQNIQLEMMRHIRKLYKLINVDPKGRFINKDKNSSSEYD